MPPPVSILVVTDWFPPASVGGVEAAAWALALAAAGEGVRVAVLCPALPGGPLGVRAVRAPGGALVRIYYAPRGAGRMAGLTGGAAAWAPPSLPGVLALLRSVARRERTTTLHAHSTASPFSLATLAAARALGLPAVLTDHSMAEKGGGRCWWAAAARAAWDAAAAGVAPAVVSAVSAAAAADTAARLGRPPGGVTVLRNAIDGGALAPAAVSHAAAAAGAGAGAADPPSTIRVLSVSRLTLRKGSGGLGSTIRAASAADPGLAFTVVGGGPGRADLVAGLGGGGGGGEQRAARLRPPPPRIALPGPRPPGAIPPLLACHDMFLSASATEAFGLAALEAAAVGLAVVAPDVGGVREALGGSVSGAAGWGRGGGGGARAAAVTLVPPSAGPAGLAAAVVAVAADLRAGRGATVPMPPPLAPLAAVLASHCWHGAAREAVGLYRAATVAWPPLPGRPLTRATRAVVHALLVAWAAVLDALEPPGREPARVVVVEKKRV